MNANSLPSSRRLRLILAGMGALAVAAIALPVSAADVSVNVQVDVAPPPLRHEVVVESTRPGPDYVWIDGFWDGSPGHYVWVAGHWDRPPRHGVRWAAPHWERDHSGHYYIVRGQWR